MDRVVKHLYGKLYMGPFLVPHYYVQFDDSDQYEFVRCSDVNVSNAQKIAFDTHFGEDEAVQKKGGIAAEEVKLFETPAPDTKRSNNLRKSKPLAALNFIQDGDLQRAEDDDSYESSFVKDSTPTVYSSSDYERADLKTAAKTKKKRKRAVLESDDELSSESTPHKPTTSKPRKQASLTLDNNELKAEGTTSRRMSTAWSKYTPLIILGANSNVTPRSSGSFSEIPVITLE